MPAQAGIQECLPTSAASVMPAQAGIQECLPTSAASVMPAEAGIQGTRRQPLDSGLRRNDV